MSNWMECDDVRKQVVMQSLQSRSADLRRSAGQCRKAYVKDYMSIPMNWLADAYDEAASVLDAKLAEAAVPSTQREGGK
jgi:hypothetical protein